MTTPDQNSSAKKLSTGDSASTITADTLPTPDVSPIPAKAKEHNIRVSAAVLDAAGKDGDELLQSLRTVLGGLTQSEAEVRARISGPNGLRKNESEDGLSVYCLSFETHL